MQSSTEKVAIGPVHNKAEATNAAKQWLASHPNMKWTGEWRVVAAEIDVKPRQTQTIQVGPIFNNDEAKQKAAQWVGANPGWSFTGKWRTTQNNTASEIDVIENQM